MEHYKSDIEGHEYQIKRYQWFSLKPNQENVGSVSKSRKLGIYQLVKEQSEAKGLEQGHQEIILKFLAKFSPEQVADRFTFLSLGEVIGSGTHADLEGSDIRRLMAGGAEIKDLQQELATI